MHHRRFFCPTDLDSPPWSLDRDEARHALKALRLKIGDEVVLMDGRGGTVRARLAQLSGERALAEPAGSVERSAEPALRPWLLVGAPEPAGLDEIMEHAVELGAWRILVVHAGRTPAPFAALEKRKGRWETLIRSAGKQSGNPWFPEVVLFGSMADATAALPPTGFLLAQGAVPLRLPASSCGDFALAVGPEGDFTPEEVDLLVARRLVRASVGTHTLRVGTACLAALAVLGAG
jgi:16S rRNA (uracil1498-N3)-methyltransferase